MRIDTDMTADGSTVEQAERPEVHICPPHGAGLFDLVEVFRYYELVWTMARRRIRTRFDTLYLGVFWVVARALLMTFVFQFIRNVSDANMGDGLPYMMFLFSGFMMWFYIADSINAAAHALESDATLVKNVYFPRLVSPVAPIIANLIEIVAGAVILVVMMAYFDLWPGWRLVLLPAILLQVMAMILGVGLIFSALSLAGRDWNHLLNHILYIGLFMSPVLYSPEQIPGALRDLYFLNPAAGTLTGMRSVLFDSVPFPTGQWSYSVAFSLTVLIIGLLAFHRVEHRLLDRL